MKLRAALLIGLLLLGNCAQAASARARTYGLKLLTISEVVTNPGTPSAQVTMIHSGVASDGGSTGAVSGDRPENSAPPLAGNLWAPVAYGTPTLTNLVASATAYSRTIVNGVIAQLKTAMKASQSSSAIFQYDQEVQVLDPTTPPPHLIWTVYVDSGGRVFYGDPIVIPASPTYIYAIYTPLSVASGLPAGWAYPDAGTLRYQVLKVKDNSLVQMWVTLNVNGAYDDPVQSLNTGINVDPDKGLKCLMNKNSGGCTIAYSDMVGLLGQNGSVVAVVDYTRQLQPTMQNNADGTVSPKTAVSYDQRNWSWSTCTYQNIGSLGMELNAQTDRYLAMPNGQYSKMGTATQKSQAPTQPFNISAGVAPGYVSALSSYVFDPISAGNPISQAGMIPGIINLAPISESGSSINTTNTGLSKNQSTSFYVSDPSKVQTGTLSVTYLDDGGVVAINGRTVFAGNSGGPKYWMTGYPPGRHACEPWNSPYAAVNGGYDEWGNPYESREYDPLCVMWEQSSWGYNYGTVDIRSYLIAGNNTFATYWGGAYGDIHATLRVEQKPCQ